MKKKRDRGDVTQQRRVRTALAMGKVAVVGLAEEVSKYSEEIEEKEMRRTTREEELKGQFEQMENRKAPMARWERSLQGRMKYERRRIGGEEMIEEGREVVLGRSGIEEELEARGEELVARTMIAMMDGRERGEGWCDFKKKEEALWDIKKKEEDLWWTWHKLKEEGKGFHDARKAKK